MVIKVIKKGIYKDERRFFLEKEDERETLESARTFFGDSYTFLTEGLGYSMSRRGAGSTFHAIRSGKQSISVEQWEKIEDYASKYRLGRRYGSEIFIIPTNP